ncbi:MAG: prepilin-type N-terminal cleavage/methylation domain-containing protein [Rhodospirillales bacterium]
MRPSTDAGFTLLEVIVAFAISALAVGVLYEGASGGLLATGSAAKTVEALSLAQSHLAAIGHGDAIAQQETSGADGDGFEWHLRIRPIASREMNLSDSDRANDTRETSAVLYDVTVTESWTESGRTHQVAIGTHRIDMRTAEGG